jgi:hypothetical protein
MWESARPWEEKGESLKVNESKMVEQELDDEDRQARFWRRRPDGFAVDEKEHIIYVLEFKRVSDVGQEYVAETQQLAEAQHLAVTQGLQKLFKDTHWTVEQLSFVVGHKSVSASVWHDLLLKFSIRKEDRVKVIKNLGRTLLDELENLFRSYWGHRLGVSDGLLQVLGHSVRVKTQELQGHQLQGPEHHTLVTLPLFPAELAASSDGALIQPLSLGEHSAHSECGPVFQDHSVHVPIVLPLLPSSLTQGAFVASTETHSVQVSSARKGVSHRLHQPTLHLPWDSLVSQPLPNDFSAFPFSGEEVARPCIREWFRV